MRLFVILGVRHGLRATSKLRFNFLHENEANSAFNCNSTHSTQEIIGYAKISC